MVDRYRSYEELAANERLGIDYRIRVKDCGTSVVIMAPHGGRIEPGTSEIAEAVAETDFSFYAFEALRLGAHNELHITSHRFDEPEAVALLGRTRTSIAIHGRKNGGRASVWLGGRAVALRDTIGASLRDAGFQAEFNKQLPGLNRLNICNRTLSGQGVQLELPQSLRHRLNEDASMLEAFSHAIRATIPNSTDAVRACD